MKTSRSVSVGEEGVDFVTLSIVSNPHNPSLGDIYLSHQYYYGSPDRRPVVFCVNGRAIFTNQLELFVRHVSYYEPKSGSLLLIGQVRDLIEGRFYEVEVFYSASDISVERSGHMRIYLAKEEVNPLGVSTKANSVRGLFKMPFMPRRH